MSRLDKRTKGALLAGCAALAMLIAFVYIEGLAPAPLQAAPSGMGAAQIFAVLGSAGVTASGAALIDGDVGSSPTATIIGFPDPGSVTPGFTVHDTNDEAVVDAQSAVGVLFTSLGALDSGPCLDPDLTTLTGEDFTPGVYCFSSTATLANDANFTLTDPSGTGTYIFRVTTGLTANTGSTVTLVGADPCKVFWQIGTAATLNGQTFAGNVITRTGVTLGTGADLTGRALVTGPPGDGPVTLVGDNTVGGCSAAVPPPEPPTLAKGFLPIGITEGEVSTLTIILSNPNTTVADLTAALTDTLPDGVVVADVPNADTDCDGSGDVAATAGGTTVTLPLTRTIPGGAPGTCTVTVDVTAPVAGAYINTLAAGALQTSNGDNADPVSATLTVVPPVGAPTLAKGFLPLSITAGRDSVLTIVLINPNDTAATLEADLIDTLPAGVVIDATPGASTTCGGSGDVAATAGGTTVTLPLTRTIPGGAPGTCTVTVDVTAPAKGVYVNTLPIGALQTSNGDNADAVSATLTVVRQPSSGGGGGGGGSLPTPTPTVVPPAYVFLSSAFCLVEVCPYGQQYLQAGEQMYATFSLNKVPAAPVRGEAYLNGVKYKDISWPGPFTSAGPFTTATLLGLAPDAGIIDLRVWVGAAYVGAFSTTVVNPFVKGTCPGSGADCPQIVGPAPSGIKLSTLGAILLWSNPTGTAQVHIRIRPANDDGPGINLILGSPAISFVVPEPVFGSGNYIILPGMTYTWQARVTSQITPATETDPSWGPWSDPQTFQTRTASSHGISLLSPTDSGTAATLTPTLRWSNSDTGAFYYEVQLSADPAFNTDAATAIASVYWNLVHGGVSSPENSWTVPPDFALQPGTAYHWRVRPRIQGDGVPVSWSQASSFSTR